MQKQFFIGGHVSSAGGISEALPRAKAIGANCVQIFSASPRVWARSPMPATQIERFNFLKKTLGIEKSVIHAIYLLNLASDNPDLVAKSRNVIEYDLNIDAAIGGEGVVVHLGSHLGRGFEAVKDQIAAEIKKILAHTPERSTFLIENSAGQKGKIASDLAEIRWLLDSVASSRLGWCLDTCHAHAAGYHLQMTNNQFSISNEFSMKQVSNLKQKLPLVEEKQEKNIFFEIERLDLWETLKVIHVNDSRDPFASGRDRHENLGDGSLGSEPLRDFLSHEKIRALPLILEVPGMDHKSGPDAVNVQRLQNLCQ